ncbi:hypothetical protein LPJ66_005201 [Kickxella alabastrina]|uniref:Uncharacterized protein n=1 Tax=Kickxella alabastrina TaxID=61397 RepID=A0ACC1ILA4_9FUNG|nr:hypothetical protein LPJ66_005201 [Kickxella alabastrina]
MIIGYGKTRDVLSLYSVGDGGVVEMALCVPDEIVFGFLVFERTNVLVTHVSEKISTVAEFLNRHDITINTTKPTELTPVLLRSKASHLVKKSVPMVTRSLGRSDSIQQHQQQSKVRSTIWHRHSMSMSHAPSSSVTSLANSPRSPGSPASEADTDDTPLKLKPPAMDSVTEEGSQPNPGEQVAVSVVSSVTGLDALNNEDAFARSRNTASTSPCKAAEPTYELPLGMPPTPKSLNGGLSDIQEYDHLNRSSRYSYNVLIANESAMLTEIVIPHYSESERSLASDAMISPISPIAPSTYVGSGSMCSKRSGAFSDSGMSPTAGTASLARPTYHRYSLNYSPERQSTSISSKRKSRVCIASSFKKTPAPEVAQLMEEVSEHRRNTAELAQSSGLMGDKFFRCLRGYTSIQEPSNSFWKRRYFVIADETLFMYTNECSRTPTDFWPLSSIVRAPRNAEDDVLMAHSLAMDFGAGEHFLYFDNAQMRQAFEGEVLTSISATVAAAAVAAATITAN